MSDDQALLPCPFCNRPATIFERDSIGDYDESPRYDVRCGEDFDDTDCLLGSGADWYFHSREEVVEKWNTRTGSAYREALVELRRDLKFAAGTTGYPTVVRNYLNCALSKIDSALGTEGK